MCQALISINTFVKFFELANAVLNEGYAKITPEVNEFIRTVFLPKLKDTTVNYKGVLVFDIVKAARTKSYDLVTVSKVGTKPNFEFVYEMEFKHPQDEELSLLVHLHYTCLRAAPHGVFSRMGRFVKVYVPCVTVIDDEEFVNEFEDAFDIFGGKGFNAEQLQELQQKYKQSLKDVDKHYLSFMQKGSTVKYTLSTLEHEFIHALDPASRQNTSEDEEFLQKHYEEYMDDYYGTPYPNAGKIPAEFNSFFWNIISSFATPLSSTTREFLLDFIKNPIPLINKLRLFDVKTLDIGKLSAYVYGLFKGKDYTAFLEKMNEHHHRKMMLRVFQDPYLKKKFLQKLYLFVQEN